MTIEGARAGGLEAGRRGTAGEVFRVFLKLGLTSFGGPVAHIGYFREECVVRRQWLTDRAYADIVALCQFLPGPASSQVGIAVGLLRAGYGGALAAWTGFTLPSAILLAAFALGVTHFSGVFGGAWLHGLKVAAVAVVAQAVLGMMRSLAPDRERATLAVAAAALALAVPTALGQIGALVLGAAVGLLFFRAEPEEAPSSLPISVGRGAATAALVVFVGLLIVLPLLATASGMRTIELADAFYRAGSLVFGGGHVVLPMLQAEVVPDGWIGNEQFLAGYGAAQAVPGPLFTFAAYLGMIIGGWWAAIVCMLSIFASSFLLVIGALPYWESVRGQASARTAMRGINAAVVGLLLAALYHPVWTAGILSSADFAIAMTAFLLLHAWKVTPWLVVLLCGVGAAALSLVTAGLA